MVAELDTTLLLQPKPTTTRGTVSRQSLILKSSGSILGSVN